MNGYGLALVLMGGFGSIFVTAFPLRPAGALCRGGRMIRRAALLLLTAGVAGLAGCGGGSVVVVPPPPPPGPFSNASLKGAYAFAFSGTNTFGFFSIAGSLQADGNGNITSGLADVHSGAGIFPSVAITGTYSITGEGRGTATLISSLNPITIAFVMISAQRALVVRFDNNATASGAMDLQNPAAFSTAALAGAFAFNLGGVDASSRALGSAGNFTADNAGNFTAGIQDFNDDGVTTLDQALSGSLTVGAANGRGTATLTTSLVTLSLAFYIVDSTHLKLVEMDPAATLGGDAFRQQGVFSNASLSGSFPLTLAGNSALGPFVSGGIFMADGNGNITGGVEDVNNDGVIAQNLALTPTAYSIAPSGRGTLVLTSSAGTSNFVIYPSSGGVQMLEVDAIIVSSGSALAQTGAAFSNASLQGNYGFNLTGANLGAEIDAVAQFTADGNGHLTGTLDFNNGGSLFQGLALTGTYSVGNNGHGTATLQSSAGTLNLDLYLVSSSRVLFIEVDPSLQAVGTFEHQ